MRFSIVAMVVLAYLGVGALLMRLMQLFSQDSVVVETSDERVFNPNVRRVLSLLGIVLTALRFRPAR